MHAPLLSVLGLALLGALHAQDTVPVQTDFQQDKVTQPASPARGFGVFRGDARPGNVRRGGCRGQAGPRAGQGAPAAPRLGGFGGSGGGQDPGSSLWGRDRGVGVLCRGVAVDAQRFHSGDREKPAQFERQHRDGWWTTPQHKPHPPPTWGPKQTRAAVPGVPHTPLSSHAGAGVLRVLALPFLPQWAGPRAGQPRPRCTLGAPSPTALGSHRAGAGATLPAPPGNPRGVLGVTATPGRGWGQRHILHGWGSGMCCTGSPSTAHPRGPRDRAGTGSQPLLVHRDGCKWHLRAGWSCHPRRKRPEHRACGNQGSAGCWVWGCQGLQQLTRAQDPATVPLRGGRGGLGWRAAEGQDGGLRLSGGCVQITGRWYSIGLASNSNWFKEKKHLMKMCTTVIAAAADGNLEVTSTYPKYGHGVGERGMPPTVPCLGLCVGWSIAPGPADALLLRSPGVTSARRGTAFTPRRSSRGDSATPAPVSARLPARPPAGQPWTCTPLPTQPCHPLSLGAGWVCGAELCPPRPPRLGQQARHPRGGDQLR